MRYWYIHFEGVFKDRVEKSDYQGLYSNAMLFNADETTAREELMKCLGDEGIELTNIEDFFESKETEVDFSNPENRSWINMYEEVRRTKGCVFTPWHTFKLD